MVAFVNLILKKMMMMMMMTVSLAWSSTSKKKLKQKSASVQSVWSESKIREGSPHGTRKTRKELVEQMSFKSGVKG